MDSLDIPLYKKSAPVVDGRFYISRDRLVQMVVSRNLKKDRNIFITGQGGYGKSVFAAQYLKFSDIPHLWYQLGSEDLEPVSLVGNLYSLFHGKFHGKGSQSTSGLDGSNIAAMVENGELFPGSLKTAAESMARWIKSVLRERIYIVFDDLHLVAESEGSLLFLKELVNCCGRKIRFVFISRLDHGEGLRKLAFSLNPVIVDEKLLAVTPEEVQEYCFLYGRDPLSLSDATKVVRKTGGWMMGVASWAFTGFNIPDGDEHDGEIVQLSGDMARYFDHEVIHRLAPDFQEKICMLSHLKEIPEDIAASFEARDILDWMWKVNLFTGKAEKSYVFHHIFQEFLQERSVRFVKKEKIKNVLFFAAQWHLDRENWETALEYGLKAEAFDFVEEVLERHGLFLLSENRFVTLEHVIMGLSGDVIARHGWLSLYTGILYMNIDPPVASSFFTGAAELLKSSGSLCGEALALSYLVSYHVIIDGNFSEGNQSLKRLLRLYGKVEENENVYFKITVLTSISQGQNYFQGNPGIALETINKAVSISSRNLQKNFLTGLLVSRAYYHLFISRYREFYQDLESLNMLVSSPNVSPLNKMYVLIAMVNVLEMEGDFQNYRFYRDRLVKSLEGNLVSKTVFLPFINIWNIDMAVAGGEFTKAQDLVDVGLKLEHAGKNPHFSSQMLHYQALVSGIGGDEKRVRVAAKLAFSQRKSADNQFFVLLCSLMVGAAYSRLLISDESEKYLGRAIENSHSMGEVYLRTAAHIHRFYVRSKTGSGNSMEDLETGLWLLKKHDIRHFFSWIPDSLSFFLGEAVKLDAGGDFAGVFARRHLNLSFSEDGRRIPLLRVNTLGAFSVVLEGREILNLTDLTAQQRYLFVLLLSAPGKYLIVNELKSVKWPGKEDKVSRRNFDVMSKRLRDRFVKKIGKERVKDYFRVSRGIISLHNISTDYEEFLEYAQEGLKLWKKGERWQAANRFRRAHRLWKGDFISGMTCDILSLRTKISSLSPVYEESINAWCDLILEGGDFVEEDMTFIEMALTEEVSRDIVLGKIIRIYRKEKRSHDILRVEKLLQQIEKN